MISKIISTTCAIALACAFGPGIVQAEEAAATPPAKAAAGDPMANVYGNTILLAVEPFWAAKQYYEPDHTWRQVASDGAVVGGTWKIENGQSCTFQTTPPGPTYCNPYVPRKVGDTWLNHDDAGNTTVISLVAGRE